MNTTRTIGALTIAALATISASCSSGNPETNTLTGTFTLTDSSAMIKAADGSCVGDDGYDDITTGLYVIVTDDAGKTLSTGALAGGRLTDQSRIPDCVFDIVLDKPLPKTDYYKVSVGTRGELTYSYDELVDRGWVVAFNLG